MEDDGNCQFRSLAAELFGSQNHHLLVRAQVVEFMTLHADEYSFYIGGPAEWARYLSTMARARTWVSGRHSWDEGTSRELQQCALVTTVQYSRQHSSEACVLTSVQCC